MNSFDIVIPVGPKDVEVIYDQVKYTQSNVIGYRNIYLVSKDSNICIDGCTSIDESSFPFTMETVAMFHGKRPRNGWYLQQLLKLYAGKVIPCILDRYLVIDSDTFFLRPTSFVENGKCLYNYGREKHTPYFTHMSKLADGFVRVSERKSGICHHMMFETRYIDEIISIVEQQHNDKFYNVFLKLVIEKSHSGASEYEIYFNYICRNHTDGIKIRKLLWKNAGELTAHKGFDYISCHWHSATKSRIHH